MVLYGADQYQFNPLNGVQLAVGVNLNDRIYIEGIAQYFFPQHSNALFVSDASGNPFFARPFFNTVLGQERAFLTASPGIASGSTSVQSRLQIFSIEAHARCQVQPDALPERGLALRCPADAARGGARDQ